MELSEVQKHFSGEFVAFPEVAKEIERRKQFGSFSDRHPDLGKMMKCPFCGVRRRQYADPCCAPAYATTVNGKECEPRMNTEPFSKQFMKRLRHKKHGQSRMFQVRQILVDWNNSPTDEGEKIPRAVIAACVEMRIPVKQFPQLQNLPSFAEKYFLWKQERQAKVIRRRAKQARKISQ